MKNKLAENLLRFGIKNLNESEVEKLQGLAEQFNFSDEENVKEKARADYEKYFKYLGGNSGNLNSLIGKTAYVFNEPSTDNSPANMTKENLYTKFTIKLIKLNKSGTHVFLYSSDNTSDKNSKEFIRKNPYIAISDSNAKFITYMPNWDSKLKKHNEALQNYVLLKAFNRQVKPSWA